MPYVRKRGCKCENKKKCKCGATWSFTANCGTDPVTGERIQIPGSGYKTRQEAWDACVEIELQYKKGTYVKGKKVSFREFSEDWLKHYQSIGGVSDGTVDIRRNAINRMLKHFDKVQVHQITTKMYQDMLIKMKEPGGKNDEEGYAQETLISTHNTGQMMFEWGIIHGYTRHDPTKQSKLPREDTQYEVGEEEEELPKFLEKEELAKFLKVVEEYGTFKDYVAFYTLAYTGIRIGELSVLCEEDLFKDKLQLRINKTVYNGKCNAKKFKLKKPKTKKSRRIIDIDETVVMLLEKQIVKQKEIKMSMRNIYYDKHNFIFANSERNPGYPEHRNRFVRRMRKYLSKAKLSEELTPHSLRHTHTSLLAEAGVSLEAIMDRLGHKDDNTTRLIYLHVTKKVRKEASQKFAELMRGVNLKS
ncbi:tyrosine-type recombinase/integrase [Paenibacillus lentus]|uniref:tyrosine-type recombinase/integrase n=1 Tax=Paenibacillus lentus TaxID=1338368 RepID=UPI00365F2FF2